MRLFIFLWLLATQIMCGNEAVSEFCELVHQRIFFTIRLTKLLEQLKEFSKSASTPLLYKEQLGICKNLVVKKVAEQTLQLQSIQPLLRFWYNDFVACKYLEDADCGTELVKLLFIIMHNIMHRSTTHKITYLEDNPLDIINYTTAMAYQFYFSHRLMQPLYFLYKQFQSDKWVPHETFVLPLYKSSVIHHLHLNIQKNGNIEGLFTLWQDMRNYRYIYDFDLPRDAAKLIFLLFCNYLTLQHIALPSELNRAIQNELQTINNADPSALCDLMAQCIHVTAPTHLWSVHHAAYLYNHYLPYLLATTLSPYSRLIELLDTLSKNKTHEDKNLLFWAFKMHKRYYFILRLLLPLDLIKKARDSKTIFTVTATVFDHISFRHKRLQDVSKDIKEENNFDSYFQLWQEIKSLTWVDDQLMIDEFAKMTLALIKDLLLKQMPTTKCGFSIQQLNDFFYQSLMLPIENILDIIDLFYDAFTDMALETKKPVALKLSLSPQKNGSMARYPEAMALRYYLIQRLHNLFHYFELFDASYCFNLTLPYQNFSHDRISSCMSAIHQQRKIKPLLVLWKEFNQYRSMDNSDFCAEFIACSYLIAYGIILEHNKDPHGANHIGQIAEKIDLMTLQEMLEAIDLISQELPALLEKYEFSSTMHWKEWLKKYWWAPPLILATLGIKLLMQYKTHQRPMPQL